MITVANHTLFPHAANWSVPPAFKRRWQTGIATAVSNAEQRAALRALPLNTLTFTVTAASLAERSRLDARIDQAMRSGYGCTPFHGRSTGLANAAAAGSNTLTLSDVTQPWPWAIGDYAILTAADDTFDCWQVTGIAGNVLTLAGNLVSPWAAGEMVSPVLFGKFSAQDTTQITNFHAAVKLTFTQLVAERSAQLGNLVPDAGTGVGHDKIGVNNLIA